MPLIILLVLCAVAVIWYLRVRKPCDWQRDKGAQSSRWTCATCGAMSFSTTSRPPDLCKRNMKDRAL